MPIRKFSDFTAALTNGGVMLTDDTRLSPFTSQHMSVHFMELPPGGEVRPHTHARTEAYIFLTGSALVLTGDDIEEVSTGDVAVAPAGTPHAIKVLGHAPLLFYAVNSPPASSCTMREAPEEVLWKWKERCR